MNDELFETAVQQVTRVIENVNNADFAKPTPCSEWNLHQLANHLLNEVAWITPLLQGKTIAQVGRQLDGDLVKNNPKLAWQTYVGQARQAVANTSPDSIAHLSYADKQAQAYLDEVSADMIVHGWDLAKALGQDCQISDNVAEQCLVATKDIMPSGRQYGFIGSKVTTETDASVMDKMLAEFGRSASWPQ